MNNTVIIARKEWTELLRSNTFLSILMLLTILTVTSLIVSFLVFNNQMTEYDKSLEILKQIGKIPINPPPVLYPLNLLRGVVDYIEIIGAILGIILGYISVARERSSQAFKLLLTRPVTLKEIFYGKILGNGMFIYAFMLFVSLLIVLIIIGVGGIMLTFSEMVKVGLFVVFSTLYILIFFMLSFILTLNQESIAKALILSFIVWLMFVLILPQIGDTMDPDNQVPGGFFKSMNMDRTAEKQILANFNGYENARGFVEQLSITKHYERLIFALFGVKTIYNDRSLMSIVSENLDNVIWIIMLALIGFFASIRMMNQSQYTFGEIR